MSYQQIVSQEELAELMKASETQPVLFFKHSNSCGISQRAFAQFEQYLQAPESQGIRHGVIVVQQARAVSDALARLVGVEHESPQAILVRAGRAVWNESHMALKSAVLAEAIRQH